MVYFSLTRGCSRVHGEAAFRFPNASRNGEILRLKLNNKTVRGLAVAGKTDLIVFDDDMPGFGFRLRLLSSGRINKTWVVQYRSHGRSRRVLIGSAEVLGAEQARAQAKKVLGAVALGRDPRAERESTRLKQAHT